MAEETVAYLLDRSGSLRDVIPGENFHTRTERIVALAKFSASCGYISVLEQLWVLLPHSWYIDAHAAYISACQSRCIASFRWFNTVCSTDYRHRPWPEIEGMHTQLETALREWAALLGFESKNKDRQGCHLTTEKWLLRQFSPPAKRLCETQFEPPAKRVTRAMASAQQRASVTK
jgi:hypothetical protein